MVTGSKQGDVSKVLREIVTAKEKDGNVTPAAIVDQTETASFKNWFGDWENEPDEASKVVDENGKPKVVLHGTPNTDFYEFKEEKIGSSNDPGWLGRGFYFYGNNPEYARQYAKGGRVMEVYLNIRNPYYATVEDMERLAEANSAEASREFRERLEAEGYDGVYYNGDLNEEWVAFHPNQIKSATENVGTYDRDNDDVRYRDSKQLTAEYGDRWLTEQTNEDGRHSTQVKNTLHSYEKFGNWVKADSNGREVSVLDASSGLGLGTKWLRENGITVDDVEPYPSPNREAPTYKSYDDVDKQYDYIISNAVLNVIPDDWRAELLHDMADKLKVGGKMLINVRDTDSIRKQGVEGKMKIPLDDPSEVLVLRPDGSIRAYQKGFTKDELKAWCESELGEGYQVEIANKKNAGDGYTIAVVVTKNNESTAKSSASELGQPTPKGAAVANFDAKVSEKNERTKRLSDLISHINELFRDDTFGRPTFEESITQGKLLYADKEKIQTLIDQQRINLADVDYLDLNYVAKIIKGFANPSIDGKENVNELFRDDTFGRPTSEESITQALVKLAAQNKDN